MNRLFSDISLFVELANLKHFGKASSALKIPAATLSRRIGHLEKVLGTQLIVRNTRTFSLTAAGLELSQKATNLVGEAGAFCKNLTTCLSHSASLIRVSTPADLGDLMFQPLFSTYMQDNPGVRLELIFAQSPLNPQSEGLDIAFVVSHQIKQSDSSCKANHMCRFKRGLYASTGYLKSSPRIRSLFDLQSHRCLSFSLLKNPDKWEFSKGERRETVTVKSSFYSNSVGILAKTAAQDGGITVLPAFLAADPNFGNGLVQILPRWTAAEAHILAVVRNDTKSESVQKLLNFLRTHLKQFDDVDKRPSLGH